MQNNTLYTYGRAEAGTRPGVGTRKTPKYLSASESEECGHGEGGGVYATLMQSDTLKPYGVLEEGEGDRYCYRYTHT